ncbi:MAG TPA: DUF1178 family protein [Sphingomicrobium sp.]|nr:DUF1178 family protein [Sphingomicrobium sp.]
MIVFDLCCLQSGDRFEAWFRSSADFDEQLEQGLVHCPVCESSRVAKAPMAPMVPRRSAPAAGAVERLAELQADLLRGSEWVGDAFADTARAMHLGEIDTSPVHGEATLEQARSLLDDEVPILPLPLPVVPPKQVN